MFRGRLLTHLTHVGLMFYIKWRRRNTRRVVSLLYESPKMLVVSASE